jgi:DNA helicase HerA-like ATPase
MLDMLRKYQRQGYLPTFPEFISEVKLKCNVQGQKPALEQRLALLESFILESSLNSKLLSEGSALEICKPGTLIIVDLTDPLLSSEEVNGIFQVLTEQYRSIPNLISGGKLLILDEAHKFMKGVCDGLTDAIINCARLMRHDGMRLIISTQSPLSLSAELLELTSLCILHRFFSRDWFAYLEKKIPLSDKSLQDQLINLSPGNALIFAGRHKLSITTSLYDSATNDSTHNCNNQETKNLFFINIRQRITADRGTSKANSKLIT